MRRIVECENVEVEEFLRITKIDVGYELDESIWQKVWGEY